VLSRTFLGASNSVDNKPTPPKAIACPTGCSGVAINIVPDATRVPPPAATADLLKIRDERYKDTQFAKEYQIIERGGV